MEDLYSGTSSEFIAQLDPTTTDIERSGAMSLAGAIAMPLFFQYRHSPDRINTDVFIDHLDLDSVQNKIIDHYYPDAAKSIAAPIKAFLRSLPHYQEELAFNRQSSAFNEAYGFVVMSLIRIIEAASPSSDLIQDNEPS